MYKCGILIQNLNVTSNTHKRKNREFNHTENKCQLSPKRCASAVNQHHNSGGMQNLAEVICIRCVLLHHSTLPLVMSNVSLCKWLHCKRQGCSHSCYDQLCRLLKFSLLRFCDILKYGTVLRHICSNTICSFNFAQPTLRVLVYKTCSIHFSHLRYMHSHVNAYSVHFS